MPANQAIDLPLMYMIALIGFFAGGIASYVANLLLFQEGIVPDREPQSYCGHRINIFEAIPLFSLLLLSGKCKNCRRRIQWQYTLCEILTAVLFIVLAGHFGFNFYSLGMMFFVAVLISICITDFKAKIIPHEITYPAIILGIIFSAMTKSNVIGPLAGIGASYILFDFLAFYGLKFFLWCNPPTLAPGRAFISMVSPKVAKAQKVVSRFFWTSKELQPVAKKLTQKEYANIKLYSKNLPIEELEIIGGGDAVLSALISAWLGWQRLIIALSMGFLVGTFLGAIYVLIELKKERLLQSTILPILGSVMGMLVFAASILISLALALKESIFLTPYQYILPGSALIGCLLGVVIAGAKISKPFPFGPALVLGAITAIFREE